MVNEDVGKIYEIKILCISARYYVKSFLSTFSVLECCILYIRIKVITKLPNSEQSYKGKVKTHNYINRQNQSTTGKL